MEIEKQRGISVTSSVMQFQYERLLHQHPGHPGHQDFSEDTYRTLMAADSAVMVIDAAKGVEAQTRKLFKVCAMRDIPIFTFINKMDREAQDPLELCEELEKELGIDTYAMNWPIGSGKEFQGVYDREQPDHPFLPGGGPGQRPTAEVALDDPALEDIDRRKKASCSDEMELLDGASGTLTWTGCATARCPRVLRLRPHQLRRGALLWRISPHDHAAPAPEGDQGEVDVSPGFLRLCVQDPGQHEQGPPGPAGLYADLLRHV